MVTDTSKKAFELVDRPSQHKQILGAIDELGCTCIADVAAHLCWQRSTVAARMNELAALGDIELITDKQGRPVKWKSVTTGVAALHYQIAGKKGQQEFEFAEAV